jgi:hypothetical protein
MTKEEFDTAVKALRGKVAPKSTSKRKTRCTPEDWAANLDYMKMQKDANPEKNRESARNWYSKNRGRGRENSRRWYAENPEKARENKRSYRNANRERARQRHAERLKNDPNYKVRIYLRNRLLKAVGRNSKNGSAVRDLGCTIAEFWVHIESKFQPGMTRENMGKAWEIDHIFPLAKANLKESRVEFLAANNWRNLQPLTPEENDSKNDKVTPEAQELFDKLKAEFAA